jgi:cytoskeletal protein RodZ
MASIGETLREARKRKGFSPETTAKALKIKVQKLVDLEEDRFETFAAHLYARSFLKHYAQYLGLDSAPLLQQFEQEHPAPDQKPIFQGAEKAPFHSPVQHHVPRAAPTFSLTSTGRIVLAVSLLITVLFVICLWLIISMEGHSINKAPPPPASSNAHPNLIVPLEPMPEPGDNLNDTLPLTTTNAAPLKL